MSHTEFVAGYTSGRLLVAVPPGPAAKFIAARMWLPWVLLPLFSAAVAFALLHAWVIAIVCFAIALVLRGAVRATAAGYIRQRALADAAFYEEVSAAGLLQTKEA